MHDLIVMFCSIRRGGKSLGEMVRDEVGPFAGIVSLVSVLANARLGWRCLAGEPVRPLQEETARLLTDAT